MAIVTATPLESVVIELRVQITTTRAIDRCEELFSIKGWRLACQRFKRQECKGRVRSVSVDPLLTQFCGQVVQVLPVALPPFREWLLVFGVPAPSVETLRPPTRRSRCVPLRNDCLSHRADARQDAAARPARSQPACTRTRLGPGAEAMHENGPQAVGSGPRCGTAFRSSLNCAGLCDRPSRIGS